MGRRNSRGFSGPFGSQEMRDAVALIGAAGFSASNSYSTANGQGEAGSATGFGVVVLFSVLSQAVSSTSRVLTGRFGGGAGGWSMDLNGTLSALSFNVISGAPAGVSSPVYTVTSSDVGKIMMAVGVFTTTHVRLYVNRAEVGSGTAITGHTPAPAGSGHGIGAVGGSFSVPSTAIFGVSAFRSVPTLAQVQALFDDVRIARDIVGTGLTPTHGWSFKRAGGSAPPASVSSLGSGTDAQTRSGAPTYHIVPTPVWGW